MGKNHKKIIIAASGAVAMALSLCACQVGGSTSAPAESKAASDTITMMNYPDWIGENEASAFKDETGYTLKQVSSPTGGTFARLWKIAALPYGSRAERLFLFPAIPAYSIGFPK